MKAKEIFKKLYNENGLVFFKSGHMEIELDYDKEADAYYFIDKSGIGKEFININGRKDCTILDHEITFTDFDDNEKYTVYVYQPLVLKNIL